MLIVNYILEREDGFYTMQWGSCVYMEIDIISLIIIFIPHLFISHIISYLLTVSNKVTLWIIETCKYIIFEITLRVNLFHYFLVAPAQNMNAWNIQNTLKQHTWNDVWVILNTLSVTESEWSSSLLHGGQLHALWN